MRVRTLHLFVHFLGQIQPVLKQKHTKYKLLSTAYGYTHNNIIIIYARMMYTIINNTTAAVLIS